MQCMISKCDVKLVRCDDVFVVIYTMYNKTVIRFGFCDFRNNRGLGTCKFYQPQPLVWLKIYMYLDLDYSGYHKSLIQ